MSAGLAVGFFVIAAAAVWWLIEAIDEVFQQERERREHDDQI